LAARLTRQTVQIATTIFLLLPKIAGRRRVVCIGHEDHAVVLLLISTAVVVDDEHIYHCVDVTVVS
jgi:hypothetical protein